MDDDRQSSLVSSNSKSSMTAELDPVIHSIGFEIEELSPRSSPAASPSPTSAASRSRCSTAAYRRWWRRPLQAWAPTWPPDTGASPASASASTTSVAPPSATSCSPARRPSTSDAQPRCGR